MTGNGVAEQVLQIAVEAGREILDIYEKDYEVIEKADGSPVTVANESDLVFACMPSIETFRTVITGEEGVIYGNQMKTFVNLGTVGTEVVSEMEEILSAKGIPMLDAPITGGVQRAWACFAEPPQIFASSFTAVPEALLIALKAVRSRFCRHHFFSLYPGGPAQ